VKDLERYLRAAVQEFWSTRSSQALRGAASDRGSRSAVTGGAQMNGFVNLVRALLIEDARVPDPEIHTKGQVKLPGYFRPEKEWDLLVVCRNRLIATIEFKSHIGPSFGNNFNNRTEEALGSACDIRTAYREGAFAPGPDPWLGYLMLLEDAPGSRSAVKVSEPHFKVFEEFRDSSYARRYEILLTKLVRERLYNSACLLLSGSEMGRSGDYVEPSAELGFANFARSLVGHALSFMQET
jgi:hypothetical protein